MLTQKPKTANTIEIKRMDIIAKIIDKKTRLMMRNNKAATAVYLGGKEFHELLSIDHNIVRTPMFIGDEPISVLGLQVFKVNVCTYLEVV